MPNIVDDKSNLKPYADTDPGLIKNYKEGGGVSTVTAAQRDNMQKGYNPDEMAPGATDEPRGPAPLDLPRNPPNVVDAAGYTEGVAVGGTFDNVFGDQGAPALRPAEDTPPEQVAP